LPLNPQDPQTRTPKPVIPHAAVPKHGSRCGAIQFNLSSGRRYITDNPPRAPFLNTIV